MIRSPHLRPLLVGLALLCALQLPAAALTLIKNVTPAQAKELGITVNVQPRPEAGDIWVKIDFKTVGDLKRFTGANLTVTENGKQLVSAQLMASKPAVDSKPEEKQVAFYVEPSALAQTAVTIVSYNEPLTGTGYRLQMKDFMQKTARR